MGRDVLELHFSRDEAGPYVIRKTHLSGLMWSQNTKNKNGFGLFIRKMKDFLYGMGIFCMDPKNEYSRD